MFYFDQKYISRSNVVMKCRYLLITRFAGSANDVDFDVKKLVDYGLSYYYEAHFGYVRPIIKIIRPEVVSNLTPPIPIANPVVSLCQSLYPFLGRITTTIVAGAPIFTD